MSDRYKGQAFGQQAYPVAPPLHNAANQKRSLLFPKNKGPVLKIHLFKYRYIQDSEFILQQENRDLAAG